MKTLQKIIISAFLSVASILVQSQNVTEQVHGTFINFSYQDERNKYMNPEGRESPVEAVMNAADEYKIKVYEYRLDKGSR